MRVTDDLRPKTVPALVGLEVLLPIETFVALERAANMQGETTDEAIRSAVETYVTTTREGHD